MPGWPQESERLKNVTKMPTHSTMEPMYVRVRPGSRMTLKTEICSPMKPDW